MQDLVKELLVVDDCPQQKQTRKCEFYLFAMNVIDVSIHCMWFILTYLLMFKIFLIGLRVEL